MNETAQESPFIRPRKPWIAALLSLPCPGLGHLYAGDLWGMLFSLLLVYLAFTIPVPFALSLSSPITVWLIWLGPLLVICIVPVYAWLSARRAPKSYQLKPYNRWYVYLGCWVGWSILAQFVIQTVRDEVLEAFRIPSGSMEPSVLVGDFIYVDKRPVARGSVENGTIIVFRSIEEEGMQVIKRVVGLPGDTVAMVEGRLQRNGIPINEPYINPSQGRSEDDLQREKMRGWQSAHLTGDRNAEYRPDLSDWGPLLVPPHSYLALGDNRDHAYDSRYWGFVPEANIVGQPSVVYWSYDKESYKPIPRLFAVRWNRIGHTFSPKGTR